jgi:adenylate cyclase, class 2
MARETEIKLRVEDLSAFQAALARVGAKRVGMGRVFEENVVFDSPDRTLAKQGQLLRIRTETRKGDKTGESLDQRFLLTFKRPTPEQRVTPASEVEDSGYKVREEIEVELTETETLSKIFDGLGMKPWFHYEKYRTTYQIESSKEWGIGLLIELDETPIGVFAELEGPPEAIDRAAAELGFSKVDFILGNYFTLYVEECRRRGEQPGDMVFRTRPNLKQ